MKDVPETRPETAPDTAPLTLPETAPVTFTESAARAVLARARREGKEGQTLRLFVMGGGCSGVTYRIDFDSEGARLLTWSGTWGSFNAVRLWCLEPVQAIEWKDENFNDRDVVPPWLPDLAEAVTGHGETSGEDGDLFADVPTLEDFAKKYANAPAPSQYKQLWARFLDPAGCPK